MTDKEHQRLIKIETDIATLYDSISLLKGVLEQVECTYHELKKGIMDGKEKI